MPRGKGQGRGGRGGGRGGGAAGHPAPQDAESADLSALMGGELGDVSEEQDPSFDPAMLAQMGGAGGLQGLLSSPMMLEAIQGHLNGLIGKTSGYLESLPAAVRRRVDALENLEDQHEDLEAEFRKELAALELKYEKLYQPLLNKRADIVNGKHEPTDEECERPEEDEEEDEEEEEKEEGGEGDGEESNDEAEAGEEGSEEVTGIPEFWLSALKNCQMIAQMVSEKDEEILKSLTDMRCHVLEVNEEGEHGFRLEFDFAENEFFENKTLTKVYYVETDMGEESLSHTEGTEIKWKAGKNVTVEMKSKKQRRRGTNQTRVVRVSQKVDSFFNFFTAIDMVSASQQSSPEMAMELVEEDYMLGEFIRIKFVPHAVRWFIGDAEQFGPFGDMGGDDEFDDEEGDEEGGEEGGEDGCKQQ